MYVSSYYYISSVLILLYMCPHTATSLASSYCYICVLILLYVSSYCYICVLILLYRAPTRLSPHVKSCVLILLYVSSYYCMCPHTAIYVSSYYYMCPHTAIYVSSYCYTGPQHVSAHTSNHAACRGPRP
jgi:hypothetical protein